MRFCYSKNETLEQNRTEPGNEGNQYKIINSEDPGKRETNTKPSKVKIRERGEKYPLKK